MPVFCHCFKELKASDTILKVLMILHEYISFFNYHIIEELGTKAELQRYKEDINWYAKRRIFECLPEFGRVSDYCEIALS